MPALSFRLVTPMMPFYPATVMANLSRHQPELKFVKNYVREENGK